MSRLKDKVAIVLGAGGRGNMGQAIARRFADEGACVVVSGRNSAGLDALAEKIGARALSCDISRRADIEALARGTIDAFGKIDVAVDCAGINLARPFLETTEDDIARLYALQFKGPFQFLQVMVTAMMGGGSIIQIGSAASTIMLDDYAAYRGTKAAMDQVVRSVADEFGRNGIRANTISPGAVLTPMTRAVMDNPAVASAFAASSPLDRIASVEEIAAATVWLASDECFMTGETLHVSGGLMLRRNPTQQDIMEALAHG